MTLGQELAQVLAQLELLSHGSTQNYNSTGRGGGGRVFPPGGIGRFDSDTHVHFRRRLARASERDLEAILEDAKRALKAAYRQDLNLGPDPERGSFVWKWRIANSPETVSELARKHTVSRQKIYRWRVKYGDITQDEIRRYLEREQAA